MANGVLTVSDIITRVQRTFGDESAVQVTNEDIIRWINDACREAVMQHENLLQKTGYIDSVVGQREYSYPVDAISVNAVLFRDSTDLTASYYHLRYMSPTDMALHIDGWQGNAYGNGVPQIFTRSDAGKFAVFPPPQTAYVQGFKVIYARYAVDVVDTNSVIDLPAYYHPYVEHFCMMKAYEMDEDWDSADRKAQLIQSTLNFNVGREDWFGRQSFPTVVDSDYY